MGAAPENSRLCGFTSLGYRSVPRNTTIRPVEQGDAEAIAAIYAPHVTAGVASFETEPPDAEEFRRRISATTVTHPWLVCERDGEVVGYVYATTHNPRAAYQWSTNVTVYVDSRQHRGGIGRALYTSLFELLKLQGFYNAYGGITLPNAGSVGLHESMGFRLVGVYEEVGYKFGAWHDVGWWGLELQPKPTDPLATVDTERSPYHSGLAKGSRRRSATVENKLNRQTEKPPDAGLLNPVRWPMKLLFATRAAQSGNLHVFFGGHFFGRRRAFPRRFLRLPCNG